MSTITASFTAVGDVSTGLLVADGQSATCGASGTYAATVVLERTNDGGQTWETVLTSDDADATVSQVVSVPGTYRWRCSDYTSGTVDMTLGSDAYPLLVPPIRNAAGETVLAVSSNGVTAKRRVVSHADAATVTPNADTTDVASVAALSQTTTFANPTGTPYDSQVLEIRVTTASGGQTVSFGNKFRATAVALPTATTGSAKTDRWLFEWIAVASKWDALAVTAGA